MRALEAAGARTLFTLNGGHIWPVLDAARRLGLQVVDTRDELTAAFAAEATSKLTRTCGFAAVTAGPGVTNSVSALAGAFANDGPMFLLGGRAGSARWGEGQLQEMDHLGVVGPVTREAMTLRDPSLAFQSASSLVARAWSRRTGPVFMEAPVDVLFSQAGGVPDIAPAVPDPGLAPDPEQVALAARLLGEASQPVMVVGAMAWWARCEEAVAALAEQACVPVYAAGQARGMIPAGHRLRLSRSRPAALRGADLVVVVGAPLDFRLGFGEPPLVNPEARLVYVDVDGRGKRRPPAAAVYGDLRRGLEELARRVPGISDRGAWLDALHQAEAAAREADRPMLEAASTPVHPARLVGEVAAFIDEDAVVIGDGGDFVSFAGRIIERAKPGLWLDPGPFGCLGTGAGYAMAARLAHPDRQIVLLSGDGAFGFSAMDFDTLVRHRLPVVCVIGNNGGWALEDHPMRRLYGDTVATRLRPGVRYDRVVEALGGHGELVERPEEIRGALERAFRSGVPACVNVLCDPEAEYPRSSVLM